MDSLNICRVYFGDSKYGLVELGECNSGVENTTTADPREVINRTSQVTANANSEYMTIEELCHSLFDSDGRNDAICGKSGYLRLLDLTNQARLIDMPNSFRDGSWNADNELAKYGDLLTINGLDGIVERFNITESINAINLPWDAVVRCDPLKIEGFFKVGPYAFKDAKMISPESPVVIIPGMLEFIAPQGVVDVATLISGRRLGDVETPSQIRLMQRSDVMRRLRAAAEECA
jgi:hypothetical protein